MHRSAFAAFAAPLVFAACAAHAEIFRCTSGSGAVTYQQDPCGASESARKVDVPSSYPAADITARERLFAREAALEQRLEAERERRSRETIAHVMQPEPVPAPEVSEGPEIIWLGAPVRLHRHPFRSFLRRGGLRGGLRHN